MRLCERNKSVLAYAFCLGKTELKDANGDSTGEYSVNYSPPISLKANVGPVSENATLNPYGIADGASLRIVTNNTFTDWDTATIWWVGVDTSEPANYITTSVSRSLSATVIRLKEVAKS